jgi:hypothetical protein
MAQKTTNPPPRPSSPKVHHTEFSPSEISRINNITALTHQIYTEIEILYKKIHYYPYTLPSRAISKYLPLREASRAFTDTFAALLGGHDHIQHGPGRICTVRGETVFKQDPGLEREFVGVLEEAMGVLRGINGEVSDVREEKVHDIWGEVPPGLWKTYALVQWGDFPLESRVPLFADQLDEEFVVDE